jgi:hypothetical protein
MVELALTAAAMFVTSAGAVAALRSQKTMPKTSNRNSQHEARMSDAEDGMLMRVTVRYTDTATLKASPLWREIMAIAFTAGDVEVIEIAKSEDIDEE